MRLRDLTAFSALLAATLILTPGAAAGCGACGADHEHSGDHSHEGVADTTCCGTCGGGHADTPDLVDTAISAGSFNTLVAAVQAAGLEGALRGEGPLTVFAPTDDAFAALPEGTVEGLLQNTDQLSQILLYHVVPGEVKAEDVVQLSSATTLQGSDIAISTEDGVQVNGANVVQTDIVASNGVIHVIDAVILPPAGGSNETAQVPGGADAKGPGTCSSSCN